ncbi:hypothetical protein K501DRAFT_59255 [Backusella circina FSU 941]|nr:hypothetical protein K501DRAFT_59255 [Backusella circina FSU 941]
MNVEISINDNFPRLSSTRGRRTDFLEADMSDSIFDFPLRKQCSTSALQVPMIKQLGISSSQPDLLNYDEPATPPSPSPLSGGDLADKEAFMTMEPEDLIKFRKWIVGFCVVNFDLEIGQGNRKRN